MATRYWGDEKHPDAIYAVYLRKVRYVPPQGYEGVPVCTFHCCFSGRKILHTYIHTHTKNIFLDASRLGPIKWNWNGRTYMLCDHNLAFRSSPDGCKIQFLDPFHGGWIVLFPIHTFSVFRPHHLISCPPQIVLSHIVFANLNIAADMRLRKTSVFTVTF